MPSVSRRAAQNLNIIRAATVTPASAATISQPIPLWQLIEKPTQNIRIIK